jgi:hypothetical protein
MRKIMTSAALGLALFHAESAWAQLGARAKVTFAADRLMGIYIFNEGGRDTTFGLGGPPAGSRPYELPRFAFDFFVVDHLSLGGAFVWASHDGDSHLLVSPRVGYAADFSHSFGIWPRGGLTYRNDDLEHGNNDEVALTIEAMFYGAPAEHFAFIFGPAFDIGLAGDGPAARNFGLITFGVLGWI